MISTRSLFGFCLALGFIVGCGSQEQTTTPGPVGEEAASQESAGTGNGSGAEPKPDAQNTQAEGADAGKAVQLQLLDYEGIEELIASHKGKIVVMDVWATTCDPCIKEFPGLVALDRKHADDVACISVSSDFYGIGKPEDQREAVIEFLQQQNATFDNVLSTVPDTELYAKLGFGSIPAVFVYNRDGELAKRFGGGGEGGGELSYETEIHPFVEELLEQDGP